MFLSDEWHALTFTTKLEGEAICGRVSYYKIFFGLLMETNP
jgi:hypothetical protein